MDLAIFDQFETGLASMTEACNFIPDASTKDGYEHSKRIYLDNRGVLKAIDDAHKAAKKPHLDAGRVVDKAKNEIRAKVEEILNPHKLAYQAVDNAQRDKEQSALKVARKAASDLDDAHCLASSIDDVRKALRKVLSENDLSLDLAIYLVTLVHENKINNIQFKEQ